MGEEMEAQKNEKGVGGDNTHWGSEEESSRLNSVRELVPKLRSVPMAWEMEFSLDYGTVWKALVGVTAQCENMTNSCCNRRVAAVVTEWLALLSELFVLFVVIVITVFTRIADFSRKRVVKNQ